MASTVVGSLFFFFKQKTAYEMLRSLVGSEMCIETGSLAMNGVRSVLSAIMAIWALCSCPYKRAHSVCRMTLLPAI